MITDEPPPRRTRQVERIPCPECGEPMSPYGERCKKCEGERRTAAAEARLQAEKMDRHHRFEAAREAGWTYSEIVPNVPTWEEIGRRDISVLIRWGMRSAT